MCKYMLYYSDRGIPLITLQTIEDKPILTVENYEKWYRLFLLHPDGKVTIVSIEDIEAVLDDQKISNIDHYFNPLLLQPLADRLNAELPSEVLEIISGRWLLETKGYLGQYLGQDELG